MTQYRRSETVYPNHAPNVRLLPKAPAPTVMDIILQAETAKATKP